MTRTRNNWPSQAVKQLIPINQLITLPEGIPIPFDHLEIADLSHLPRGVTLITFLGPSIKVLITKTVGLHVKVVCKVSGDDTLAQKYGVKTVAHMMNYAAGLLPVDQEEATGLPSVTSAGWKLPDEVTWQFELFVTITGAQVLAAIRVSDKFIMKTTEEFLAQRVSS